MRKIRQRQRSSFFDAVAHNTILAVALSFGALPGRPARAQALLDQYVPPPGAGGGTAFQPGVTVLSRSRPDYDSSGVTAGNFIIRPELDESFGYDSNPVGTTRPRGSPLIETNASVNASATWSLTQIHSTLSVDDYEYPRLSAQSYTDWTASVGGSHNFGANVAVVNYSHQALTQLPTALDTPQLQVPLPYTIDDAQASYRINLARTFITPALDVQSYSFGNSAVGGAVYDQSYRNRIVVSPSLTGGYELSPRRDVVVVFRDSDAVYSHASAGLPRRNYNDAALLGGLDYDADGVVRFRLLAGYELRTFSSSQYKTIQGPVVEASAIWTPTGLTTVTATAARQIEDSADETTAGYTVNSLQGRVDHEYLPNVLLRAKAGGSFTNYRGGGNQNLYTFGTGVTYLMNRNVQVALNYDFSAIDSSGGVRFGLSGQFIGDSYTDHRISLQVRLRL